MPHCAWAPMVWLYPLRRAPKGDESLELLHAVEQTFGLEPSEPPSVIRVMQECPVLVLVPASIVCPQSPLLRALLLFIERIRCKLRLSGLDTASSIAT